MQVNTNTTTRRLFLQLNLTFVFFKLKSIQIVDFSTPSGFESDDDMSSGSDAGSPSREAVAAQLFAYTYRMWSSFEDLYNDINNAAEEVGFAIVKRRSSNKDPSTGQPCRYDLVCDQGKASKPSQATSKREAYSRKHGCPWKAVAAFYKQDEGWRFTIKDGSHNHDWATIPATIPTHRRRKRTAKVLEAIQTARVQSKNTSNDIAEQIREKPEFSGIGIIARDVEWEMHKMKAAQLFLHELSSDPTISCCSSRLGREI